MTHLQQTCADMADSQAQLQRLYALDRGTRREPRDRMRESQIRFGIEVHTQFLCVCGKALQRHPAVNDEAISPEAA